MGSEWASVVRERSMADRTRVGKWMLFQIE